MYNSSCAVPHTQKTGQKARNRTIFGGFHLTSTALPKFGGKIFFIQIRGNGTRQQDSDDTTQAGLLDRVSVAIRIIGRALVSYKTVFRFCCGEFRRLQVRRDTRVYKTCVLSALTGKALSSVTRRGERDDTV